MNLAKYLVPLYQVADPATSAAPPVDQDAPPLTAEPVTETPPEPAAPEPAPVAPPQPTKPQIPPAVIGDLTKLRAERREQAERADRAERELREAKDMLARLQSASPPAPGSTTPPTPAAPAPAPRPADPVVDDAEVDRRAAEKLVQRDMAQVSQSGIAQYGARWTDTVNALSAFGVNTVDFVNSVIEIDRTRAHEIMHDIAQDGELAMQLAAMSPVQRIARIANMAAAKTKPAEPVQPAAPTPAAKPVSAAPRPAPPVQPSASSPVTDYRTADGDALSDAEWSTRFEADSARRAARFKR